MTNKEFLEKPIRIKKRIESLKLQKEQFEVLANSIPGGNYDKPVVQMTRTYEAPFVKWIDKIFDDENKIEHLEIKYEAAKAEVMKAIEKLSKSDYQTVLIMRYLNEYSWAEVCEKLYISLSTAKRWHWEAVNALQIS
jgi:DNA-directed RNA polymerase specialized sigma24 family protein